MGWLDKIIERPKPKEKTVPKRQSIMRNSSTPDQIQPRRQSSLKSNNYEERQQRRQSGPRNTFEPREQIPVNEEDQLVEEEIPVFEPIYDPKLDANYEDNPNPIPGAANNNRKNKNPQEKVIIRFIQKHPIITSLVAMLLLIIFILAIVLPLALVKRKEERAINPK